jgi:hypothetical protein
LEKEDMKSGPPGQRERRMEGGGVAGWAAAKEEKKRGGVGLGPAGRKEKREGRKGIPFFLFPK